MTSQISFDDIPALEAMVSDDFGSWGPELTFTQDQIDEFAALTGDHQWLHVDVERAKSGPWGATIAHGFLTLSMAPTYYPPLPYEVVGAGGLINYGCERMRFLAPVRAGEPIKARARLTGVRKHARGTLLHQELSVVLAETERPALSYQGLLLYTP